MAAWEIELACQCQISGRPNVDFDVTAGVVSVCHARGSEFPCTVLTDVDHCAVDIWSRSVRIHGGKQTMSATRDVGGSLTGH